MDRLPRDIQEMIFSKVSFPDVYNLDLVSKGVYEMSKNIHKGLRKLYPKYVENKLNLSEKKKFYNLILEKNANHVPMNELTPEQKSITEYKLRRGENMVVQAYAGTGKTTTLKHLCESYETDTTILCIAFNNSIIKHLKNIFEDRKNIYVYGFHKLAYKMVTSLIGNFECVDRIKSCDFENEFKSFCYSNKETSENESVDKMFAKMVAKEIPFTHDAYLKYFELLKIDLGYDVICVDEAQDCNDCMTSIILNQNSKRVFFGDIYQNINTFRNKDNDYLTNELFNQSSKKFLSVSFRYGGKFGIMVNEFLKSHLNSNKLLNTVGSNETMIKTYFTMSDTLLTDLKDFTFICRKNETLFFAMFTLARCRKHFKIMKSKPIDFEEEIIIHRDFCNLMTYNNLQPVRCTHSRLQRFDNIYEADVYFRKHNMSKWILRSKIAEMCPPDCWELSREYFTNNSNTIITNTHQAKGMEFDNLIVSNDFKFYDEAERKLFYTAITRVKKELYLPHYFYGNEFKKHQLFDL